MDIKEVYLKLKIEEYNSVRQESLDAVKTINKTVSWSATVSLTLFTAGFALLRYKAISAMLTLYGIFLPVAIGVLLQLWLGEIARMMRAGLYVRGIEKDISEFMVSLDREADAHKVDLSQPLKWEHWLRKTASDGKTPQLTWLYAATLCGYFGGYIGSAIVFWITLMITLNHTAWWPGTWRPLTAIAQVVGLIILVFSTKEMAFNFRNQDYP